VFPEAGDPPQEPVTPSSSVAISRCKAQRNEDTEAVEMSTISKTEGVAALAEVLRSEDLMIVKRAEYRAMLATFAVSLIVVGCLVIVLALL
jgi:hypothetical protein